MKPGDDILPGRISPEPVIQDLLSEASRSIEREDYKSALQHLEEAYRMEHQSEQLIALLGFTYYQLDHHDGALRIYAEGTRLYPKNDEFWSNYGAIHANAGRYTEALESFRNALVISNSNPETWCRTGHVLSSLGRYREALLAFDNALLFNPDSSDAREGRKLAEKMAAH